MTQKKFTPDTLPEGWTIRKTRFLYALVRPDGKDELVGLTPEACAACLGCLEEFGGVKSKPIDPGTYKL